ncbi:hypothetical protein [Methanoculleus chikugoensis]|uniref:hypothetical protein n=1 Tax=Methanoculleus chikugoensis TaxID=118126 RepID=UPI001FB49DD0|nr:hypothetical protein [Methanoculleus chikugoensis]
MADRYAEWLSVSPGRLRHALPRLPRLWGGCHRGGRDGHPRVPAGAPVRLTGGEGIESVHPSVAATFPAHGGEIGGERAEPKNLQMTILQQSAHQALEEARDLVADRNIWRSLLDTDHIRRMAMRSASCGKPLHAVSHQAAHDHFASFMRVLSDFEERSAASARSRKAVLSLRCVPPEKAFYFSSHERPAGYAAHSLQELLNMLEFAPDDVIRYHVEREDFTRWIDLVIGDENLAKKVSGVADRAELRSAIRKRIERLWNRLK